MILEKLREIKENKKAACFYINKNNTRSFLVGYVLEFNDKYFLIASISNEGLYDGFILMETSKIIKIEIDNKYIKKILTLIDYQKTVYKALNFNKDNLVKELISFAQKQNYIVSIELVNGGYYNAEGYVNNIEKEGCEIRNMTQYGENDGIAFIKFSDITKIECNCLEQIALKILNSKLSK